MFLFVDEYKGTAERSEGAGAAWALWDLKYSQNPTMKRIWSEQTTTCPG